MSKKMIFISAVIFICIDSSFWDITLKESRDQHLEASACNTGTLLIEDLTSQEDDKKVTNINIKEKVT